MERRVWRYFGARPASAIRPSGRLPELRKLVNMVCRQCQGSGICRAVEPLHLSETLCEECGGSGYC